MKLFIFEYFSSGMGGRHGLVKDGLAMLDALLRDFTQVPGVELITVLDGSLTEPVMDLPAAGVKALRGGLSDRPFRQALADCDCVLLVAPETDGVLARLTAEAENLGKRVLGSTAAAAALAGDKAAMLRLLSENLITVPRWAVLNHTLLPRDFPLPFVIKPVKGTGGEGVRLIHTPEQWQAWLEGVGSTRGYLVQELIPGPAVSVSVLARAQAVTPLSLNLQHIGANEPVFRGITVPYRHRWAEAAMDIAVRVCALVPGLRGFAGVDFILGPRGPVVLELNARVTFAYIALRRVISLNLARELLGFGGEGCPVIKGSHTCLLSHD